MKTKLRLLLLACAAVIMMLSMGITVFAEEGDTSGKIPYTGTEVTFIKKDGSGFGMWAPQEGTTISRNGNEVNIHYVPKNKTTYGWIHWGPITDTDLSKDLALNEDGTIDITLSAENCGYAIPVAPIKVKDGATTGDQYYLAVPSIIAGDLTINNTTKMFKAVTASIYSVGGTGKLTIALSGSGYKNLYKGTYQEAIDNGIEEANRSVWIKGQTNADGKIEFVIPLESGEKRIPVVAISESHLAKVEAGEETIEQCMFYRLFEIDYDAMTITVGDYYEVNDFAITNNVKMFKPGETCSVKTTGTSSSNNYANELTLTMGSDSFDKVKADSYSNYGGQMTIGDQKEIAIGEGKVFADIPVIEGKQILKFHSVSKDAWYNRKLTVDLAGKTITFDSLTEEEEALESVKDEARDEIAKAEELDKADYSDENVAAINDAVKALDAMVKDPDATADKINEAKQALTSAVEKAEEGKQKEEQPADDKKEEQPADDKKEEQPADDKKEEQPADDKKEEQPADDKKEEQPADDKKDSSSDQKAAEETAAKQIEAEIAAVKKAKVKGFKVKAGKKKMTVKWKANTKAFNGYQISYKVGKKTKTIIVKKAKAAKKIIKKLKSKKKYIVRIRGYKKIEGKTYYGKWSAKKRVKIK